MLLDGSTFIPEAPYDEYGKAYVRLNDRGRRMLQFQNSKVKIPKCPSGTTYGRYLYQVKLWKEKGELLSDDIEIDHVNNDWTDDRIENLQPLTRLENIRKRDYRQYQERPITPELISELESLLDSGWSRSSIVYKFNTSFGFIRYVINLHLPKYAREEYIIRDLEMIKTMLDNGRTQNDIADEFGVDQATISRLVNKHLPEFSRREVSKKRKDLIGEYLKQGIHYSDVAPLVGCTPLNVWYYINKYFPEYRENQNQNWKEKRQSYVDKVRVVLEKTPKLPYYRLAQETGLSEGVVAGIVLQEFPEYIPDSTMRAKETKVEDRRLKKCKEYLDMGLTNVDISKLLDISPPTVAAWVQRYFPEYSPVYKWARLICPDSTIIGVDVVINAAKEIVLNIKNFSQASDELNVPRRILERFYRSCFAT